jgi:hypothetical protein
MTAAKHRNRRFRGDPHVRLHHWLLDSPAWRTLTPQARAIYIALVRRYNGSNNGRIGLSIREAARECRLSKNTVPRAIHELIDHGFLELKTPGGFSLKLRHATEWLLTEYRDDVSGELPKKTFMRWGRNSEHGPK